MIYYSNINIQLFNINTSSRHQFSTELIYLYSNTICNLVSVVYNKLQYAQLHTTVVIWFRRRGRACAAAAEDGIYLYHY